MHVGHLGVLPHGQLAVYLTRLDVLINSLAVGVSVGVVEYLAAGLVGGIVMGVLAFLVAFAIFDFVRRSGGPDT